MPRDEWPPTCHLWRKRSGNWPIRAIVFCCHLSRVPIADGLFIVNLGEAKAGPDSFHVISSKLQLNCISLYDDLLLLWAP